MTHRPSDRLHLRANDPRESTAQTMTEAGRHVASFTAYKEARQAAAARDLEYPIAAARETWSVGQRVQYSDSAELGTVVEVARQIKVKWDGGRTSFFRYVRSGNVELLRPT